MKRRIIIATGLLASMAGIIITLTEIASEDKPEQASSHEARQITHFAMGQRGRALQVLRRDDDLRELVDGTDYFTTMAIPWISATGEQLIGGMVTIRLDEPISLGPVNLPIVFLANAAASDPPSGKQYQRRVVRISAEGVTEITAFVDLEDGSVVSLEPGGPKSKVKTIKMYGPPPGQAYQVPSGY